MSHEYSNKGESAYKKLHKKLGKGHTKGAKKYTKEELEKAKKGKKATIPNKGK
jgi:hypothetical protein